MLLVLFNGSVASNSIGDRLQFASTEDAKKMLTSEDSFTKSWSNFDIESRLQKPGGTKEELFELISTKVLEWTDQEKQHMMLAVEAVESKLEAQGIELPMPDELLLVKTSGEEEGGAVAYTRSNYIVFTDGLINMPQQQLEHLFLHELFHVLTRNNESFRSAMYNIIGFEIGEAIEYPSEIKQLRITNPDAPQTDSYIRLQANGSDHNCMMVLYSDRDYDGGSFFKYLNIGFLALDEDKNQAKLKNGKAVVFAMNEVEGFFEQVGRNTQYIIHPEEILAENFAMAIGTKRDLANSEIPEAILEYLKSE